MEKRKKKKRVMSILGKVYVVLLFLFIYAPVFVMIAFSFTIVMPMWCGRDLQQNIM